MTSDLIAWNVLCRSCSFEAALLYFSVSDVAPEYFCPACGNKTLIPFLHVAQKDKNV